MHTTQVLIEAGADVSIVTPNGYSALTLCKESSEIAKKYQIGNDHARMDDFEVCVCVCVCVCDVCIHVCIYVCIHVCMRVCIK